MNLSHALQSVVVGACLFVVLVVGLVGCAATSPPVKGPKGKVLPANDPSPVALIGDKKIYADDLKAYEKKSGLVGKPALEDLIDLDLERTAAQKKNIDVSSIETREGRAQVDYQLARALSLKVPEAKTTLVVDHAWVKDAAKPTVQAKQKKALEGLRTKVQAGEALPVAYKSMKLPASWHVTDHESLTADGVPPEARELKANDVSDVVAADGALHLFKVYERNERLPSSDEVRRPLHIALREGQIIEIYEPLK